MVKCKNLCGKDLTGRQKEFCSDKCRKQFRRNSDRLGQNETRTPKSDSVEFESKIAGVAVRSGTEYISIGRLTVKQLYSAIRSYPQDTWKDSPEFKELMKRLHSMSIEELETGGYDIPCWKYSEAA